ncbi:YMGG-like glycine zipper-containing protein [Cupriavidus sp. CuC1]|uniref:YMGG-like glycine zipper-containing protein n=1 Tax=Cupriavidus sp. CuC1 TaxID=3373131 RepID=UPI0037D1F57B
MVLAGCAVMPSGPSVMVLPGTGKNFDQFRADDNSCRQYAFGQVGGVTANQAATNSAVGSAVVGTALGAAAGAAFNGGSGAAVGAGVGLLTGAAVGAGNAQYAGYGSQRQYDTAYVQCMYASGNRVPVYGRMASTPRPAAAPTYYYPPPPPPGYAPQ